MSSLLSGRAGGRTAANRAILDGLLDDASRAIDKSRFRSAAVTLQSAARFAWYNHPGMFRSLKLEELSAQVGEHLPHPRVHDYAVTGHVVHVLSQAYSSGGHTRLVWRWIANDDTRINSVVLTGQQGIPVPPQLIDAVSASGGHIISLGEKSSDLLVRAAELNRIAWSGADTIVLHVHPYDVVPSIGLVNVPAKIVFLNHADHVFWVGGSIADVVADIRPAGQQLSIAERHLPTAISTIVPIPLSAPPESDKPRARKHLGLSLDTVVLVSIASAYKYGAAPGQHFIDIHRDFVLAHPEVMLIVVGPPSEGQWQAVSDETDGRFRAVGMVDGLQHYYDAADIYVDSIPFASLTSLLDAAVRGIPVVALNETVADSVLTSNDLALMDEGMHYSDRRDYIRALGVLATQPEERRRRGEATRRSVVEHHLSPGWNKHLDGLFALLARTEADAADAPTRMNIPRFGFDQVEEALIDFQLASGLAEPLWSCRLRDAPYMPVSDRIRFLWSVPRGHRIGALKFMMPDAMRSRLKIRLARLPK